MLAETYGKISAAELARAHVASAAAEAPQLVHEHEAATLESVCHLWLRERHGAKLAALAGQTLAYAARLMAAYLQYLTARMQAAPPTASPPAAAPPAAAPAAVASTSRLEMAVRELEGAYEGADGAQNGADGGQDGVPQAKPRSPQLPAYAPPGLGQTALSPNSPVPRKSPPELAASASASAAPTAAPMYLEPPEIAMSFVRSTFDLLMQWMAVALSAAPQPTQPPQRQMPASTSSASVVGAEMGAGGGFGVALVDPRDSSAHARVASSVEEAVLHAVESLIAVHATAEKRGLLLDGGKGGGGGHACAVDRGVGCAPATSARPIVTCEKEKSGAGGGAAGGGAAFETEVRARALSSAPFSRDTGPTRRPALLAVPATPFGKSPLGKFPLGKSRPPVSHAATPVVGRCVSSSKRSSDGRGCSGRRASRSPLFCTTTRPSSRPFYAPRSRARYMTNHAVAWACGVSAAASDCRQRLPPVREASCPSLPHSISLRARPRPRI